MKQANTGHMENAQIFKLVLYIHFNVSSADPAESIDFKCNKVHTLQGQICRCCLVSFLNKVPIHNLCVVR